MTTHQPQVGDTITTGEELDLAIAEGPLDVRWFLCVSTPDRGDEIAWTCFADIDGDVWAVRPASEDDPPEATDGVSVPMADVPLPITIVATSDTRPRPEREVKAEALRYAADWVANTLIGNPAVVDALGVIARDLLAEADRIEAGETR